MVNQNEIIVPWNFYKIYYGDESIRKMIRYQFKDAEFAVGVGPNIKKQGWTFPIKVVPSRRLDELINEGLDLFVPLRDKDDKYLTILWDLEYFNRDDQKYLYQSSNGENKSNQKIIFNWMAPIFDKITYLFNSYGIKYVVDTTGSGFHIWSRISTDSKTFKQFAEEGHIEDSLTEKYNRVILQDIKRQRPLPSDLGKSYNSAGKILEFFTHEIMRQVKNDPNCVLPFVISDSAQGGLTYERSGFSSDLTQYAHPLYMRVMRVIGSLHQKILDYFPDSSPAIDIMKIPHMSYEDILKTMWDPRRAAAFYQGKNVEIPVSDEGWLNALNKYKNSETRKIHKEFETMPLKKISSAPCEHPQCITQNIEIDKANRKLLTPSNLQLLIEYFDQKGESIKELTTKIAQKYYSDNNTYGWYDSDRFTGIDWLKYDPYTAANFWGRVYWTLKKLDLGRGLDCDTIKKAGICAIRYEDNCGRNLSDI